MMLQNQSRFTASYTLAKAKCLVMGGTAPQRQVCLLMAACATFLSNQVKSVLAVQGKCTFAARLTDNQINELTQYVLEQAATGWKS